MQSHIWLPYHSSKMHNYIAAQRSTHREDGPSPESFTVVLESCSFLHGTDRVSKTFVDQPFNLLSFSQLIPGHSPWGHMFIHRDRRNCQRSWNDGHLGNPSMCLQDLLRSITRIPLPMMADCGHWPLRGIWTNTWLFSSVKAQMTPTQDETIVSMPINYCQRSALIN